MARSLVAGPGASLAIARSKRLRKLEREEDDMAVCEVCGNDYDKAFEVTPAGAGKARVFDSFECAINALAPACAHCGCKVIGHGVEANGTMYCCAHCARKSGVKGVDDRV
jgi:Rieske Fe-S protein